MSVASKFTALRYGPAGATNTLEFFLDFVCPFSKKQFKVLYNDVFPLLAKHNVAVIYRLQIQPWHPSSTLCGEAALAVSQLSPDSFWKYAAALFDVSEQYYDDKTAALSRRDIYKSLSQLSESSAGPKAGDVLKQLDIEDGSGNGGNKVTDLLKWQVKYARQNGIHVSPTVAFNGVVEPGISSSYTLKDWQEWFDKNL